MKFQIIGAIRDVQTFAAGNRIREIPRLRRVYGKARWLKRKGIAEICFEDGTVRTAELHWYEANGVGRKEFKIKFLVD